MDDVESSQMLLHVDHLADSAAVVSSSDESQMSSLVFEVFNHDVLFEIVFDGISNVDIGVRISDGPGIVGDDVWDLVGSNSSSCHFE